MFDFSILITVLIAILIFYFTLFITLKKEIDDLSSSLKNSNEKQFKIYNRKNKLKFLNIITSFLIVFVITLYVLPDINTVFKKNHLLNSTITFPDIKNLLIKLVPFKKGFFSDFNFMFSYITETILSIIIIVFIGRVSEIKSKFIITFTSIILAFILIWINNSISAFLTHCIVDHFLFLSIVFNLSTYVIIPFVLSIILISIIDTINSKKKKQ